jgi:hypothetical protein
MVQSYIRSTAPYVVGLALAAAMWVYIGRIDYAARPGQLGPDTWPKMALGLMAAVCLFEIVRGFVRGAAVTRGVADLLANPEEEQGGASHPWLLVGGIVLVSVYAVLVPVLGFLLATFLFLGAFMYLGGYRRHAAIWSISAAATVAVGLLFLRVAYVSLPRGMPPFDRFTDFIRLLAG